MLIGYFFHQWLDKHVKMHVMQADGVNNVLI